MFNRTRTSALFSRHTPTIIKYARMLPVVFLLMAATPGSATVFYSKTEAMELAFGKKADIEILSLFPTEQEIEAIEKLARVKLESALLSFYVGKQDGKVLGYAAIESRTVRTKPETLLIVLTPEGALREVHTLAFHEPPEYLPSRRWYEQMSRRPLEQLSFNAGIQGITGATLSTRSALNSTRKIMAIYRIMLSKQED